MMPLSAMSSKHKKEPAFLASSFFFYSQNLDLGFLANDQDSVFHVCFQMFGI